MGDDAPLVEKTDPPDEDRRGEDAWKQNTKAIERVISVALTLNGSETVKAIAEEARVAEQTARDHLDLLQGLSIVGSTTARGVTKYHPDAGYLRFRSVSNMVEQYDKEALLGMSESLKKKDEEASERYDAEDPEDLRQRAASEELSAEKTAELREASSEWETVRYEQSVVNQAFKQYEEHNGAGTSASA